MKPREQGGVVDERLNVYGVQNLKIAGIYYTTFCENLICILTLFFFQTAVSHQAM